MAASEPERWVIIDARLPFDKVQGEIRRVVDARLSGGEGSSPS